MKSLKAWVLLIAAMSVLFYGCQAHTYKSAVNSPSSIGSHDRQADSGLKPPNFKERRMADAMRGLTYDSGFVRVDPAAAAEYMNRGDRDAAEAFYRTGLTQLFEENDRVAAISAFTKAIIILPEDPRYFTGLGQALLYKGKTSDRFFSHRSAAGWRLFRCPDSSGPGPSDEWRLSESRRGLAPGSGLKSGVRRGIRPSGHTFLLPRPHEGGPVLCPPG